jgi:glycosyltransferase involved in cell wall biosynthesis
VLNTADSTIFSYYSNREFKPITQGAKLLYHGTVAERFGLLKAIEAVHLLQSLIPGTTLTIHSNYDPNFRLTLERKISQLHLQSRIILGGFKPLEEIRQIIDRSDLGVVPYLRDDFMELALSTKTFEYAASGLPIVASRLRSISSIFSDESIRFADPGNAQDLAERIAELCRDPERRQRQVQAALKLLPPISGSIMAARYLNLMTRLMMPNRKTNPEGVAVN